MFEYKVSKDAYYTDYNDDLKKKDTQKFYLVDIMISKNNNNTKYESNYTINKVEKLLNEIPNKLITSEMKQNIYVQINKTPTDYSIPIKVQLYNILKLLEYDNLLTYFPIDNYKKK